MSRGFENYCQFSCQNEKDIKWNYIDLRFIWWKMWGIWALMLTCRLNVGFCCCNASLCSPSFISLLQPWVIHSENIGNLLIRLKPSWIWLHSFLSFIRVTVLFKVYSTYHIKRDRFWPSNTCQYMFIWSVLLNYTHITSHIYHETAGWKSKSSGCKNGEMMLVVL